MATLLSHRGHHRNVDMTADSRIHGHAFPKHDTGFGEDATRGMNSNGPPISPPRAVVAHRSREGDTKREPNPQHQQQQQFQDEGSGRRGDSRERHSSRDRRDERDSKHSRDDRDDRDRGRDGRGRDSRNDRNSQRRPRKLGGGNGDNQHDHNNQQNRDQILRERSRSRGRHDRPSLLAAGEAHETRLSTTSIKRPRSPSISFGASSGSGGVSLGSNTLSRSQNKRSRLDRPRSRTPSYHSQRQSSSRRYSSRSPPPFPSSSSRRDRRSRNKNKGRYSATAEAAGDEGEPRRLSSTQQPPLSAESRDRSGSSGRRGSGSGGGGDSGPVLYKEPLLSDTQTSDLSTTRRSASPHVRNAGRDKDRDQRDRDRRDRDRGRDRDRTRGRERDRDRGRDRGKDHEKERGRDHDRDRNRDRNRDRDRDRDRDRARDNRGRSPHASKKKDRRRDYSQTSHSTDIPTAVNTDQAIDDDMGSRGRYRGSHGYSPYTSKGHYSSQQQKKQRQHPHFNSNHATPNTPFNGSPPSQHSPYGEPQGWPTGNQQYSPQTQHTSQQFSRNYPQDAPQGPSSSYHPTGNSPPYDAPNGPGGQYAQYAGSSRGHQYGHGRDGHAGNHNGQWSADQGPEGAYLQMNPMTGSSHGNDNGHNQQAPYYEGDDTYMQDPNVVPYSQAQAQYPQHLPGPEQTHKQPHLHPGDNSSERHDWDQDIDRSRDRRDDQMPPPSRPPPTGPQSKFSFAFKATSKTPVTAPKAEIAQKLSAVPRQPQQQAQQPQSQQQPIQQQQHRDSSPSLSTHSKSGSLQHRPHSSDSRNSFPRNAPTEPASSRARTELRQRGAPNAPSGAPSGPSAGSGSGPRYRKVKQIVRRPKPRPILAEDMAASESVYYRKPGNESVVGSGTYGQVFKAVHVYTKQLAALKKIRMDGEREGLPVTAIREIKLLQSLNHVNVVDLLEVMVEDGHCYMVFEYLSHDLNGLLNHPTFKLDAAQKKHMGLQMFQGLDYLHRRGVLHRDIKAANILVSSDGILKIADFGLARFFAKRHQLDYTNRVITIWYRSPELLLGETQYGPAVDIWSAACVLVEIFTRYPIFPGDGGEISQINKIYGLLGTPSKSDWPGLVDMPWFELLRPSHRLPNNFVNTYAHKVSPAALSLLIDMFHYDPAKRPSAAQVLEHPYFTQEEPAPRQAIELAGIGGDWHEFETKALRKENERKAKINKALKADSANVDADRNVERKKRPPPTETETESRTGTGGADGADASKAGASNAAAVDDNFKQPEAKRQHIEPVNESKPDGKGPTAQEAGAKQAIPDDVTNGV